MSDPSAGLLEPETEHRRIVGDCRATAAGPTLIAMSGLHGNEPAGVEAAARVVAALERSGALRRGRFIALAGNLAALRDRTRFIDRDLNRQWSPENVANVLAKSEAEPWAAEERQQRELFARLERLTDEATGSIYFLDLHTSSADGPPFLTVGDTLRNRRFARNFPLPMILGLEEQVDGALLEYLNNFGVVTMGVEAGRHDDGESVRRHEAVLWLALVGIGLVDRGAVTDFERHMRTLRDAGRDRPRVVEVRHRHAITPADAFRMDPGFSNFHPVQKGQVLGRDGNGPVSSPETGLVLLPLYQGKGDDGFFVAREVSYFWLRLSTLLRRLRVGRLMHFLPGVRPDSAREEVLVIDTRVARWYPLEIFHLLGFRKLRRTENRLIVSRRRFDLETAEARVPLEPRLGERL